MPKFAHWHLSSDTLLPLMQQLADDDFTATDKSATAPAPSGPATQPIAVNGVKFRPNGETFLADNVSSQSSCIEPVALFPNPDGLHHKVEYSIRNDYGRAVAGKGPRSILVDQNEVSLPFLFQTLDEGTYTFHLTIDGRRCEPVKFSSIYTQESNKPEDGWLGTIMGLLFVFLILFMFVGTWLSR